MNLLIKIMKSSQRGRPLPWFSHRYTGRFLLLICCVLAYQYYLYITPRDYQTILDSQQLRVGYIKSPEVAFEFGEQSSGFELDVIKKFAEQKKLTIQLVKVDNDSSLLGLNTNRFDILIGHFPSAKLPKRGKQDLSENNPPLFLETTPWLKSSPVIFEHKAFKTPKSQTISEDDEIFANIHFPTGIDSLRTRNIITLQNTDLIRKVHENDIPLGVSTITKLRINQKYRPQVRSLKKLDNSIPLVWKLPVKNSNALLAEIEVFLADDSTQNFIAKRKLFWISRFKNINFLDVGKLERQIKATLPTLKSVFVSAGKQENIDWMLIAALSYQESNWDIDAVSPTKVRGIMQMTKATAKTLGIKDRTDVYESVHGATRYLKELEQRIPIKAKREDRIWMAVAAYNLGISRVLEAYENVLLENPAHISWNTISKQLTLRSNQLFRDKYTNGRRAVIYVERIKEFMEILRYYSGDQKISI